MSRKRLQFTLGTLMALVTAFATIGSFCSYIKSVASDSLFETAGVMTPVLIAALFLGWCVAVLVWAALLCLPCRAALWLFGFLKRRDQDAPRTAKAPDGRHDTR
jgi:hypothetical protein